MPIPYRFINTTGSKPPDKAQQRRDVRSYVARVSAEPFKTQGVRSKGKRKRNVVVWDIEVSGLEPDKQRVSQPRSRVKLPTRSPPSNPQSAFKLLYGPTSVLPCSRTAVYHKPYLSAVLQNYCASLVGPMAELDGGSPVPLLATIWIPHILQTPILFQVIALFAASHYATYFEPAAYAQLATELIWLKQCALSGLVKYLSSNASSPISNIFPSLDGPSPTACAGMTTPVIGNGIIAATAKMASYEAIYGTAEAYHKHMAGVQHMLRLRSGMAFLGLNGFLARMLLFIDTNSAFLMGDKGRLHLLDVGGVGYPRREPLVIPNTRRFVGVCGGGKIDSVEEGPKVTAA